MMEQKEPEKPKYCKDCKFYSRKTKLCAVKKRYTARKKSCQDHTR